ncbi:hypothetical protein [Sulfurivermis fontis]|uniref:hypothetical protein n=1 Tax=Sulfurivermis fontis TaxID=1972068 RepID=UPI000FDA4C1B|nr:hypothetical protein [Sulfurivermis fontis]
MMRRLPLLLLLVALSLGVHAEEKGYKIVRPDGSIEFTDQPAPGAQEIPLPRTPGYQAPPSRPLTPPVAPVAPKGPPYSQLAITAPVPEQTLQDGETSVTVHIALEPGLKLGHRMVVLLDGEVVSEGAGNSVVLSDLERGAHTVVAEVRDGAGNVVQTAAPVTFHVRQYSKFFQPQPQNGAPSAVGPAPMMPKAPRAP